MHPSLIPLPRTNSRAGILLMHFFAAFRELPISLLISSLALASSALPVHSTELTTDNFSQLTARGLWFIEYFSPYCGHCQDFAPTWQQLVEESERDTPAIKLAQVNCVVHGGKQTTYPHQRSAVTLVLRRSMQ